MRNDGALRRFVSVALAVTATLAMACGKGQTHEAKTDDGKAAPKSVAEAVAPEGAPEGTKDPAPPAPQPAAPKGGRMFALYEENAPPIRAGLQKEAVFDKLTAWITDHIVLPRDLPVVFTRCGTINAFYSGDKHAIIICDEMAEYLQAAISERQGTREEKTKAFLGALVFFFFHEVGHALIHELDLPAVGREEDSADQIATLILVSNGELELAGYGADAFDYILQLRGGESAPFWDEHSLDQQRFYNIACLIYGASPDKLGVLVERGFLPEQRAARCPREWQEAYKAWSRLLDPHTKRKPN
jgi:hypothetical protein